MENYETIAKENVRELFRRYRDFDIEENDFTKIDELTNFFTKREWEMISKMNEAPYPILKRYKNKLSWNTITMVSTLKKEFIVEFYDDLDKEILFARCNYTA